MTGMKNATDLKEKRKKPKQADVAKAAGVVPSTVSKVINNSSGISQEIRDKVLRAIRDLGYELPASKQVVSATASRIKLVTYYQFLTRETSYFHAEVIHSILEECKNQNLEIGTVLLNRDSSNPVDSYVEKLMETPTDAVIFVGIDAPEYLEPVRKARIPGVIVNGNDPDFFFDCISPSMRDACRLATRYLISLGHREIIHVTHLYRSFIHLRLDGFRDALEEAGIGFSAEKNVINIGSDERRFSPEQTADEIFKLVGQKKLSATAIFCASDYIAFGVIQGLQRAGKSVPGDISVASFDDIPLAQLCNPAITSTGVNRSFLGSMAVRRLVERIKAPDDPVLRVEVGTTLAVRDSTRSIL
jgi:DNA-binding LacI/PurR family transcriptional regulator